MIKKSRFIYDDFSGITIQEVVERLESNEQTGLSLPEAERRLKQFGKNAIRAEKGKHILIELLGQFKSPLVIILIIATIISYSVGEAINATIILIIILASVAIDFYQEQDARNAAETLKLSVKSKATVIRSGRQLEILHEEICIGDVILLSAGKIVPADVRILFAKDFFVNQSSLTGESFPCEKVSEVIPATKQQGLAELLNIAFMGSSVISGIARAIAVKTGTDTEFGKIAEKLIEPQIESEFSRGIREFGYLIMKVTLVLVLFIFLINGVQKHNLLESFMFSLAIAVGLTPELLPMIMAVTMAKGSAHMARKGVIVKTLSVIPNFGSMEVLCTDKTGTITEDKIHLIKYVDIKGQDSEYLLLLAYLNSFYQSGIKNPLDDAVVSFRKVDIHDYTKKDEIPFDFTRKRMSVVVTFQDRNILICKGAPEEIFKVCLIAEDITLASRQYEELSSEGFRVLALATKETGADEIFTKEDETGMTLQGFIAFLDPPKQDADEVITALKKIGVEVKIITGDNQLVTQKVCKEIGLPIKGMMQGHELNALSDEALQQRVKNTTIFTRFSPDQKSRVILALKAHHHAVGYMGDGINDAPSLKTADIGISVNSATDVTREAADIILTQKDLMVLREGILEGRKTFGNTMKYILMGLSSNFGNMFSVAAATMFLPFLPMLPVQILLNNFLYDTSQFTIPTDHVDESYIQKPQRWNLKMIYSYMFVFGLTSSVFDILTFYLLYKYFSVSQTQFRTGWFMESLATQILVVFIIRTRHIPFKVNKPSKPLVISVLLCLGAGWLLPYLPFADLLGFEPLPGFLVMYIVTVVLIYLFTAELVKRVIYRILLRI